MPTYGICSGRMKLRRRTSAGSSVELARDAVHQPLHRRHWPRAGRRRAPASSGSCSVNTGDDVELEMRDHVRSRHRRRGDPRQHDAPRHVGAGLVDQLPADAGDFSRRRPPRSPCPSAGRAPGAWRGNSRAGPRSTSPAGRGAARPRRRSRTRDRTSPWGRSRRPRPA